MCEPPAVPTRSAIWATLEISETRQRRRAASCLWRYAARRRRPGCVTSRSAALCSTAIWGAGSSTAIVAAAGLSMRRASSDGAVVCFASASRGWGRAPACQWAPPASHAVSPMTSQGLQAGCDALPPGAGSPLRSSPRRRRVRWARDRRHAGGQCGFLGWADVDGEFGRGDLRPRSARCACGRMGSAHPGGRGDLRGGTRRRSSPAGLPPRFVGLAIARKLPD